MYTLGVNPTEVLDPIAGVSDNPDVPGAGQYLAPGTRAVNQDGNEYILLVAAGAISVDGLVGFWDEDFTFTGVANGTGVGGMPLAVSRGQPAEADQLFWAQTYGMGDAQADAAAAADTLLTTTATAGEVDDAGGAGSWNIQGLHFMEAATGAGAFAARISYPHLDTVVNS